MIFLEDSLRRRDYRSLAAEAEQRAGLDCGRTDGGRFGPKNQCQDDGSAGGSAPPPASAPKGDDSWRRSDSDVALSREQLKQSSPVAGGEKLQSLSILTPRVTARLMDEFGVSDLDTVVAIGGGAVRDASISVHQMDEEVVGINMTAPVDPSDPSSPRATTSVLIMQELGSGDVVVDYSDFNSGGRRVSDVSKQNEAGQNSAKRLRVASVLKQRMIESLMAAEKAGAKKAATMAAGSRDNPDVKGYRLWPVFGFDATVPRSLMDKIPDEILIRAAGVQVPPSRMPRAALLKGLRSQVKKVTIQQLMQFRDGENWWTENGHSIEMSLNLRDKSSLGYKRFQEEQKKLPALKKRNEGRSWYPIDDFERRSCDGSDKDESGQFTSGNDCGGQGQGGSTPRPPSRAQREKWRKSEDDFVFLDSQALKEGSPVIGGERLHELSVMQPKKVAKALDSIGIKDLDTVVKIGGGAVRGADVRVRSFGLQNVSISISSPIDPEDEDSGSVVTSVDVWHYGDAIEVHYGGLNTPKSVSDAGNLEAGARDRTRLRIASLMQERMIESLAAAQKAGAASASTYAAGDSNDPYYQGYRLWPQFGFDARLDLNQYQVPPAIILASFKKKAPEAASEAAKQAKSLVAKNLGFTLQQLISTREGKKWWDDNGSSLDMRIDLKDRKSLGYKKLARLKKILPKLKDRNTAEGRSLLGWLIEEVSRRSMSLFGFFGGLGQAIEQRGQCTDEDRAPGGTFGPGNDCQEDAGPSSVATVAKQAKQRNVDVMLAGGKRVAVMDQESRERAIGDFKANPKPPGSSAASTTDLWDREFAAREPGKNKITRHDPVFSESDLRNNGQFVAHEAVGVYLSNRHEEERRKAGGEGPASIIDLGRDDLSDSEMDYLVDSLSEDAIHAYEVLKVDPGFYGADLDATMATMSRRYPELASDDNAKFMFTALLAITSSGQGPDANLADADGLYAMWKEHGTVVPAVYGGGSRDVTTSLRNLQSLVDSLGVDRTRRLMSGYTSAGRIAKVFKSLAEKTGDPEWREKANAAILSLPKPLSASGELVDEVVPVASVFGPKIGSFFANLSGRHDFLTMDRWLMRTVGRVTGDLITRSTPEQAAVRAKSVLAAIESGRWSKAKLFGVDKTHGITKEALVRSLKVQARTGVIEENGAAFIWATAAERSYGKTARPRADGSKPGGYGKHEDPEIHALHQAGNSMFKSLISEQQDPRNGTARRNIREVFRRIRDRVEEKTGRRPDIDEIQAALWQYEKRLWKHLGAKTNIEENSLFSAAADGLLSGRITKKTHTPASKRSQEEGDWADDDFDTGHFDEEQGGWESELAELGIDLGELLAALEDDVEERRNFAALDAVVEIRAADCGRDDGGKFGPKNQCQDAGNAGNSESLKAAVVRWKGSTSDIGIHAQDELDGKPVPSSGSGKKLREMAAALLAEVKTKSEPAPTLYRGDDKPPSGNSSPLLGWTSNKKVAERWARTYGGQVYELEGAAGVNLKKIAGETLDGGEDEWIVMNTHTRKSSRSADCGRDDGGKFGDGNTCAGAGSKGGALSNSKGESFRGVRRKSDKTQTKVARKLYQMRVPEKNLKGLVRDLGGKVSNTFVEINSDYGDEGVNVFVRDRDNNETHYIHIGYYGATVYATERVSSQEVSRIQAAAQAAMPQTIDDRLWGRGNQYPVYVVNDPKEAEENWGGLSAKQRLKKERRSTDCGRDDGGKFGPKNQCQDDGNAGGTAPAAAKKSSEGEEQPSPAWARDIQHSMKKSRGYDDPANKQAWLNLSGTFYPVSGDHGEFAASHGVEGGGEDLLDAGWLRVAGVGGDTLFVGNSSGKPPKQSQVSALRDFAISTGNVSRVVFDDGRSRRGRVLWQREESRSTDCGRDEGGKFGPKNQCQEDGSGGSTARETPHGKWSISNEPKEPSSPNRLATTHVVRLTGDDGKTKAYMDVEMGHDKETLYVDFAWVAESQRGKGVYKSLLESLQSEYTIVSDEIHNVATPVRKAYEALGARINRYDQYELEKKKKGERRSADCGRTDGGKFGPKNQCQDDAGQGDSSPASLPAQWSPASGSEPFEGASRYSGVSASGGDRIAKSLDAMGIDPGEAIAATGAPERADVTLRTAPEFAANEAFAGGESPPIFMDFTADVAGIRRGMAGSSVLGTRKNAETGEQEKVLYHNVFEVLPPVQADAGKRHAAARAAYRSMVASIENARKSGIAEIRFSAAGRADDAADDKTAFRGYTIWPRMGFDAKLPDRIRTKLPESLSHATSLLDLHATREGTQWWADNGEDIDVSLRLGDRSSPQNKIVDRFIKHFMKERREMPLGTGDDWLSPEDLLRLDEMWQEVWDEGDLDDYEYVEKRSADCGRTDDGKFGPKNECQEDAGQGSSEEKKPKTSAYREAANPLAYKRAREDIASGDVARAAENIEFLMESLPPSAIAKELGFKAFDVDGSFDKDAKKKGGLLAFLRGDPAKSAARHLAKMAMAAEHVPEIKGSSFDYSPFNSVVDRFASDAGITSLLDKIAFSARLAGVKAACDMRTGGITIVQDRADDQKSLSKAYERGWFSTDDSSHYVLHEYAHKLQHDAMMNLFKATGKATPELLGKYRGRAVEAIGEKIRSVPGFLEKAKAVSMYGFTDELEFAAEYWTGVTLGYVDNDAAFDAVLSAIGMPRPVRSKMAKPTFDAGGLPSRKKKARK